jgi:cytochrome P450
MELLSPSAQEDPYRLYRQFHELDGPEGSGVHRSAVVGKIVTSHRACDAILRHPAAIKNHERAFGRPPAAQHPAVALLDRTMLMVDPPDHTRLRRLVSKAFTPHTVAALQPAIVALLGRLLDAVAERAAAGEVIDLMDELAFPFPVGVIGEMIGVPAAEQPQFQHLVRDLTLALDLVIADADLARADAAAAAVGGYFEGLVAQRRAAPRDDLTSALIAAREAEDRLSEAELLSMLTLLFLAGFETTTNLIGNGTLALLRNPDELAALRRDPSGIDAAVEELLRFDAPVQMLARVTNAPIPLPSGGIIAADRAMLILLGAANRDPVAFGEPDRLSLGRREAAPLSFGGGIHYCLGAGLARVEARLVFAELLRRFPVIELAGEPERRSGITIRGLAGLPIRLGLR